MSRRKEVAKFACGAEAFHAFVHASLWGGGATLTAFGVSATPTAHGWGAVANAVAAVALGVYGWCYPPAASSDPPERRT